MMEEKDKDKNVKLEESVDDKKEKEHIISPPKKESKVSYNLMHYCANEIFFEE